MPLGLLTCNFAVGLAVPMPTLPAKEVLPELVKVLAALRSGTLVLSTPSGSVCEPVMFAAVRLVRLAPETEPKLPLQVPVVMVPVVTRLESVVMFACVAPVTVAAVPETLPVTLPVKGPLKPVAVRRPVDGLKKSFDEDVFCAWLPEVVVTQVGYMVALVAVSSVMAVKVALPALPVALPALPVMLAFIEVVESADHTPALTAARPFHK